jgi:adenosine deaminase
VQEIIRRDLALTVCPLSNTALQVVEDIKDHPLKKMLDLGLRVTINSDDPAYFGGQLMANFEAIIRALDLEQKEIIQLVKNSFQYSLLDDRVKSMRIADVENFIEQ